FQQSLLDDHRYARHYGRFVLLPIHLRNRSNSRFRRDAYRRSDSQPLYVRLCVEDHVRLLARTRRLKARELEHMKFAVENPAETITRRVFSTAGNRTYL